MDGDALKRRAGLLTKPLGGVGGLPPSDSASPMGEML